MKPKVDFNDDGTISYTTKCIKPSCHARLGFTGLPGANIEKSCIRCGHKQGVFLPGADSAEIIDKIRKEYGDL